MTTIKKIDCKATLAHIKGLVRFIQDNGEFVSHGHIKMIHHFEGASHPQVIQYIAIDGRDHVFLSGELVHPSKYDSILEELIA